MFLSATVPLGQGLGGTPQLAVARQALEQDERSFGPDHPATMTSRYNYAEALTNVDAQEAERLHRQVLAFKQRTHGPRSIATGTSLNSLGSLLRKRGAMEEAERLLRQALAIREAQPQEWFDAAVTRDELACVLQATGRREEALAMRLRGGAQSVICSYAPCSKTASQAGLAELKRCGRCSSIWYCCQAHQKADWRAGHKQVCTPAPAAPAGHQ